MTELISHIPCRIHKGNILNMNKFSFLYHDRGEQKSRKKVFHLDVFLEKKK